MNLIKQKYKRQLRRFVPGIIVGGADNDPAGIATYSISGAMFGFAQLWVMALAAPMAIAVQGMCARLGNTQKMGLTKIMLKYFPRPLVLVAILFLVVANLTTLGADILALAAALELLTNIPLHFWILPVTVVAWCMLVFLKFKTIRFLLLVTIPFMFSYVLAAILSQPDWGAVFSSILMPKLLNLPAEYYVAAVGILGTTLTPFLFFWHVRQQTEERKSTKEFEYELSHEDSLNAPGLIFSQFITLFIMIAAGATLFGQNIEIQTAADVARALEPVAGQWATVFFAIGIISAGLVALPVIAGSTAYAVAELFNIKHESLNDKPQRAKVFYGIITLSLLAGVAMWLFGFNPIQSLFYSQVLSGILTPFLLLLILILANRSSVMGENRATLFENFFGVVSLVVILGSIILMFKDWF